MSTIHVDEILKLSSSSAEVGFTLIICITN